MTPVYTLFHLNLAYSSIDEAQRPEVIDKCYWPLLELIESRNVYFGVEMSGWTLEQLSSLSPEWVDRFKTALMQGRCELVGSGYIQMIGPLVPYKVNRNNQRLGKEVYCDVLGVTPRLALVNEMAYSSGMVEVYLEAGYQGIIMDRDNVSLAIHNDVGGMNMPCYARGVTGASIPVLWSDSIMFQKFQRYAQGDISQSDYLSYFRNRSGQNNEPLALYANDAEVFDYRPGRYEGESVLHSDGEWHRINDLIDSLEKENVSWLLPGQVLELRLNNKAKEAVQLTSARQPIPVKKQAKYNVSRWAVTGRDDLWLSTMCHRLFNAMEGSEDDGSWRSLCGLWSSDLRTHITPLKWKEAKAKIADLAKSLDVDLTYEVKPDFNDSLNDKNIIKKSDFDVEIDPEGILLKIKHNEIELVLNLRRGMTIQSLAFKEHEFVPVIGTLEQGYFQSIELGADFYSGGVVVELIAEHRRITDLDWVVPCIEITDTGLRVSCDIGTKSGVIKKEIRLSEDKMFCKTIFPGWTRPFGTVRLGTMTLLPDAFVNPICVSTINGGKAAEKFVLDQDCFHSRPASTLVSACAGLGGESGVLEIGDNNIGIKLSWDPSKCAALPMLHYQKCSPSYLARVIFSICEVDETSEIEGVLPEFELCIEPR